MALTTSTAGSVGRHAGHASAGAAWPGPTHHLWSASTARQQASTGLQQERNSSQGPPCWVNLKVTCPVHADSLSPGPFLALLAPLSPGLPWPGAHVATVATECPLPKAPSGSTGSAGHGAPNLSFFQGPLCPIQRSPSHLCLAKSYSTNGSSLGPGIMSIFILQWCREGLSANTRLSCTKQPSQEHLTPTLGVY